MNILQMQKNNFLLQDGFSMLESIVSLLIISLLGAILYLSFSTGIKALSNAKDENRFNIERLYVDDLLRNNIEKVTIPFWEKKIVLYVTGNTLSIQWINGTDKINTIVLPSYVEDLKENIILLEDNTPIGCTFSYSIDNVEIESFISFASIPIGVKEF